MKTYLEEFEERLAVIDSTQLLRDCLEECFRWAEERREEAEKYKRNDDDMYGWNFHQGAAAGALNIELWLREQSGIRAKQANKTKESQ